MKYLIILLIAIVAVSAQNNTNPYQGLGNLFGVSMSFGAPPVAFNIDLVHNTISKSNISLGETLGVINCQSNQMLIAAQSDTSLIESSVSYTDFSVTNVTSIQVDGYEFRVQNFGYSSPNTAYTAMYDGEQIGIWVLDFSTGGNSFIPTFSGNFNPNNSYDLPAGAYDSVNDIYYITFLSNDTLYLNSYNFQTQKVGPNVPIVGISDINSYRLTVIASQLYVIGSEEISIPIYQVDPTTAQAKQIITLDNSKTLSSFQGSSSVDNNEKIVVFTNLQDDMTVTIIDPVSSDITSFSIQNFLNEINFVYELCVY